MATAKVVTHTIQQPVYKNYVVLTMSMRQAAVLVSLLGALSNNVADIRDGSVFNALSQLFPNRELTTGTFIFSHVGEDAINWIRKQED